MVRRDRITITAVVGLSVVVTALGAGGSAAADQTGKTGKTEIACSFEKVVKTLAPPVATEVIEWTFTSHDPQPGSCRGVVAGRKIVDDNAWYSDYGKANGSCALGSGFANYTITVQTTAGARVINGRHSFQYLGGKGSYGHVTGPYEYNGEFQFAPTPDGGQCTPTDPATKVHVDQAITLTS